MHDLWKSMGKYFVNKTNTFCMKMSVFVRVFCEVHQGSEFTQRSYTARIYLQQ